jgi:hypothetical protein
VRPEDDEMDIQEWKYALAPPVARLSALVIGSAAFPQGF